MQNAQEKINRWQESYDEVLQQKQNTEESSEALAVVMRQQIENLQAKLDSSTHFEKMLTECLDERDKLKIKLKKLRIENKDTNVILDAALTEKCELEINLAELNNEVTTLREDNKVS